MKLYMSVSVNGGTSKSSILIRFSIIIHPCWDIPIFGNSHIPFGQRFIATSHDLTPKGYLTHSPHKDGWWNWHIPGWSPLNGWWRVREWYPKFPNTSGPRFMDHWGIPKELRFSNYSHLPRLIHWENYHWCQLVPQRALCSTLSYCCIH